MTAIDETEDHARRLAAMLLDAIGKRGAVAFTYTFAADAMPAASDLAFIEESLSDGVGGLILHLAERAGANISCMPKRWLQLDIGSLRHNDDGKNEIRVEVDFAKILGPRSTP